MTDDRAKVRPNKHGFPEFSFKQLKGKVDRVKQFGSWSYLSDKSTALCQVSGCSDKATWLTTYQGKSLILCFVHGEDA